MREYQESRDFIIQSIVRDIKFKSEDSYRGDIKEPLSLNLYGYCEGDPMRYVDITGKNKVTVTEEGGVGCGSGSLGGGTGDKLFSKIVKGLLEVASEIGEILYQGVAETVQTTRG